MKEIESFYRKVGANPSIEVTRLGRQLFQLSPELKALHAQIDAHPVSVGLYMGEMKGSRFMPSLGLIERLSALSQKKVFIKAHGEQFFLHGKEILPNYLEKSDFTGLVLVQDSSDRNLGLGEIKPGHTLIPILDRGDFLRREMD